MKRRTLNTFLNVLLLSFGIATITVLLLFSFQIEDNLLKNAKGFDVVVGAKGSPIQLILSSIFHIDSPTGNIKLSEAKELMSHRMVDEAIPLALGDSYHGYRIVGTTSSYLNNYDGKVKEGRLWNQEFEVVAGSAMAEAEKLQIGDKIISSHGFSEAGAAHHDHELVVTGILESTGTVLDRLILTGVETMWGIHDDDESDDALAGSTQNADTEENHHDHDDSHHEKESIHENETDDDDHRHENHDHTEARTITDKSYLQDFSENQELTSLLISYTSPLGAAQFPRFVNTETSMQAAAPSFEITRLLNLLGVGLDAIEVFGYILILAAILGIFIALLNSIRERKYDLAIMRTLGGSRIKLFSHIVLEGVIISVTGGILGLTLGHFAVEGIGLWMAEAQQFTIRGFVILPGEINILFMALLIGVISSVIPAIQAYNTEISKTLSKS